jgi:hypothetical protein
MKENAPTAIAARSVPTSLRSQFTLAHPSSAKEVIPLAGCLREPHRPVPGDVDATPRIVLVEGP